jgi:hypothetical protein
MGIVLNNVWVIGFGNWVVMGFDNRVVMDLVNGFG